MTRKRRIRRWANRWEPARAKPLNPAKLAQIDAALRGINRALNAFLVTAGWTPDSVRRAREEFRPLLLQRRKERVAIGRGAGR